jgi:hypothetical protein
MNSWYDFTMELIYAMNSWPTMNPDGHGGRRDVPLVVLVTETQVATSWQCNLTRKV